MMGGSKQLRGGTFNAIRKDMTVMQVCPREEYCLQDGFALPSPPSLLVCII